MYIKNNNIVKHIYSAFLILISISLFSGCVTQSFENNEPIVKSQANRDEMAATRISLGLGYLKMGDMPQAKMNLEKAKNFSPNLVQVHTAFAHYYETVGENELAIQSFEAALLIKDDSADTLNNYGVFLCRQGEVDAAEVQFLKAIEVPSYLLVSESYENLASCYLQNDDFEKSEMYLRKAIFHSPNRTSTLLQMVRLQYAMEDYKEGKRFLSKFERNTQRFTADSLSLAYKLYWKLGQRRTATNYANMLVKMYPQSWEGKQYLLNELEFIPADDLARRYQSSEKQKQHASKRTGTKRIVKLSPNSAPVTIQEAVVVPAVLANTSKEISLPEQAKSTLTAPDVSTTNIGSSPISSTAQASVGAGSAVVANSAATVEAAVVGTAAVVTTAAMSKPTEVVNSNSPESVTLTADGVEQPQLNANDNNSMQATPSTSLQIEEAVIVPATAVVSSTVVQSNVLSNELAAEKRSVIDTQTVANETATLMEPTSTMPIAAKRDVPLPEAIIDPIPEQSAVLIEAEAITTKVIAEDTQPIAKPEEVVETTLVKTEQVIEDATVVENLPAESTDDIEKVMLEDALHTVEPGQNLYNISVKYNVRLSALRKWNNIGENNHIRTGDKLYVVDPQTVKKN